MTSANISFSDKIRNQKKYVTRTLWTAIVIYPFVAAYYILGVLLMLSRCIDYARMYNQSAEILATEKYRAVSNIMGINGIGFLLVMLMGLMFAFQGFSYVFNQSQIDFYLSQPTNRLQRIRNNYKNAFCTFLMIMISSEFVALIIAAFMGAVNKAVLLSVSIEFVRSIILFFAVYNVTILAIMLSGTYLSAFLLTGFFAFVMLIITGEIRAFKEIFYGTFSSYESFKVFLSPLFDRFYGLLLINSSLFGYSDVNVVDSVSNIKTAMTTIMPYDMDTLFVAIIAMVFVIIFSKHRQAEMAGKSIVFRPFRWFVKIVISSIAGIASGCLYYAMFDFVWGGKLHILMCFIMILATILTAGFIEVLLDANIKRFFKGVPQTIMATAFVMLVFVIFNGDLTGFDSYIPNKDRVKNCAIIEYDYSYNYWVNGSNPYQEVANEYMEINDVQSVIDIAQSGMEYARESKKNGDRYIDGYSVTILYRMKSGRNVYRSITIPYGVDVKLMDKVISSEDYKKGRFAFFHDELIRQNEYNSKKYGYTRYSTATDSIETTEISYEEISDALRQDTLDNFSFEYMHQNRAVGEIEYTNNDINYLTVNIPIFANYTNTIELLKKYGIYSEGEIDFSDIKAVKVTNYYPGYDLDVQDVDNIDSENDSITVTYDGRIDIENIMSVAINQYNSGYWYDYSRENGQYTIEVERNNQNDHSSNGQYYSFIKGGVPEFVVKDTNN